MSSLYVHIPFCKTKCPYCDFYSLSDVQAQAAYIDKCIELLPAQQFKTAYIGGGTPSVLEPALLAKLLHEINCLGEFTIECNASSVTPEFASVIAQSPVNRISMGLQSAIESERKALGRAGGIEQVERAIAMLGIDNLSLDIMLGIPGQSIKSLQTTLEFCAQAGARHISAYLLKIEPGTAFHKALPKNLPCEDMQAEAYLFACQWLEQHGFAQYEISNFARPGYESQHNLNYWRCGEYHAIGPGAHGFTNGRRWSYKPNLQKFLYEAEIIDDGPGGDEIEKAMLALRLVEGIARPSKKMQARAKNLDKYVIVDDKGLRLTREGFLLSNMVIGKLLR